MIPTTSSLNNNINMKVAVLLTGQLRTYEMCKKLHMNSIISKYDTDVFLGIDLNNQCQTEKKNSYNNSNIKIVNSINEFYKPINIFVLDINDFKDEFNSIKSNESNKDLNLIEGMFRQFYVVKNTYKLLMDYMKISNTKYDLIIRLRFDQFLFSDEVPIAKELYDINKKTILYNKDNIDILDNYSKNKKFIFHEINDNCIYVLGYGDYQHYKYANEQFFYHNTTLIDKMYEYYDNIINLLRYCKELNIGNKGGIYECIFYLYITKFNNIDLKKTNLKGIFIREFS